MALWELDEFTAAEFLGFTRTIPDPPPFLGATFLPDATTFDIAVEYIKGATNNPVMANIITWDAEAPIGSKPPLGSEVRFELPPIKRKERIGEKELARFLQPRVGTDDQRRAINEVYAISDRLVAGVRSRVEWLRMQALSEPTVSYNEQGVEIVFDYGFNANLQLDVAADLPGGFYWSDLANSDPVGDLSFLKDTYRTETGGFELTRLVLPQAIITQIIRNDAARLLVRGSSAGTAQLSTAELNALVELYNLPALIPYDALVYSENDAKTVTTIRPLAANKSIGMASFNPGQTLWGPTAEARNLDSNLQALAPGLIVQTYAKEDPPSEWVKAVATAFPSVPEAERVVQLQVAA